MCIYFTLLKYSTLNLNNSILQNSPLNHNIVLPNLQKPIYYQTGKTISTLIIKMKKIQSKQIFSMHSQNSSSENNDISLLVS